MTDADVIVDAMLEPYRERSARGMADKDVADAMATADVHAAIQDCGFSMASADAMESGVCAAWRARTEEVRAGRWN